jgi:hypothetical protein
MSITLANGDLIVLDSEGIRREAETGERLAAQTSGSEFESINAEFVRETFMKMGHIRPGEWEVKKISGRNRLSIASFEQYAHLHALDGCRQSEPGAGGCSGERLYDQPGRHCPPAVAGRQRDQRAGRDSR